VDQGLIDQLRELAERSSEPIATMSMEQIAAQLGMTRMTLYRRAGSRREIVDALAAAGIDVQREPQVRERVIEAVAALLRDRPIGDITLEAIAEEARCSLPAIYDQFGNRQGVLRATFERYSPLVTVERLVSGGAMSGEPDLERDVRQLYGAIFDQVAPRWPILRAFVAEVLRDPESEVGQLFQEWYAPRAMEAMMPVLIRHIEHGSFRPLPAPLIAQMFVGPFMMHIATRNRLMVALGGNVPDRDATIDAFTGMFCRAVMADPHPDPSRPA
jgi:AcrR family transcriptional regulator